MTLVSVAKVIVDLTLELLASKLLGSSRVDVEHLQGYVEISSFPRGGGLGI